MSVKNGEEKMLKYISVVVPEEIDRELRFACADKATTKSRLVRNLIESYLKEWRGSFEPEHLSEANIPKDGTE